MPSGATAISALLLIAACGSSGKTAGASNPSGFTHAQGIAFARCMRSHGLSDFPDPIAGHSLQFNFPSGITPQSPAFRSAQAACRHLVAPPPGARDGESASQRTAALRHAQCMRAHGVPNYPDPHYHDGRPTVQPLTVYGINPDSPAVRSAAEACGGE